MKHQCDCGQIVEAEGENLLVATCINCGSYYIYAHEIRIPHEEVVKELTHSEENDVVEPVNEVVKPRPAKRR